jgi:hypothetical protein
MQFRAFLVDHRPTGSTYAYRELERHAAFSMATKNQPARKAGHQSRAKTGAASRWPRKRGRPTAYVPALARLICEGIAAGKPLLAICEADHMPDRVTVWRWQQQHHEFRNMILAAREFGTDALAEQCLVIADGSGDVRRDMVKIATRRWLASKIAPRRYGERVAAEVSGPDGRPMETRQAPPPMVPAEVAKAVRALVAGAEVEIGMPAGRGKPGPRIKAIIESGQPLPPELYAAIYGGRGRDG